MRFFLGAAVAYSSLKKGEWNTLLSIDFYSTDMYARDNLKATVVVSDCKGVF